MSLLTALSEVEWLTNGNSFVEMGTRSVVYTIVLQDEVIESKTLSPIISPEGWTNCINERFSIREGKKLNVFTDSKHGFHMLHTHAAIWNYRNVNCWKFTQKTRRFDSDSFRSSAAPDPGSANPLYGPTGRWVLCECRGHRRDGFSVSQGIRKADQMAKQAARFQDPEQVMTLEL